LLGLYYLALLREVVPVLVVGELVLLQVVVPVLVVEELLPVVVPVLVVEELLQVVVPVLVVEELALPQEELYLALLQRGRLVQFLNRCQFVSVCT
jgi:hypothetical protein